MSYLNIYKRSAYVNIIVLTPRTCLQEQIEGFLWE